MQAGLFCRLEDQKTVLLESAFLVTTFVSYFIEDLVLVFYFVSKAMRASAVRIANNSVRTPGTMCALSVCNSYFIYMCF